MVLWIFGSTRNLGEIVEINKNYLLDLIKYFEREKKLNQLDQNNSLVLGGGAWFENLDLEPDRFELKFTIFFKYKWTIWPWR